MKAQELKIERERTDSLVTYRNNAKIHTAEQIDQIKKSIEEFGFNDPIAVWTNKNGESEVVEGHGRLMAALELGIGEVPVIHLDRLSDKQRRAYAHVHNQLTMNTGWDFETLELDLQELDFDFEEFGFDPIMAADFRTSFEDEDFSEFDLSEEEIEAYSSTAEESLCSFNVVISCMNDEEKDFVLKMLGGETLKRFYKAEELMNEISDSEL